LNKIGVNDYLYVINYQDYEESLCKLEMKSLFQIVINEKYFVSNIEILPSRSVFIKYRISVISTSNSIEGLVKYIKLNNTINNNFKFLYVKFDKNEIEYNIWKTIVAQICIDLNQVENYETPEKLLSIIHINNKWIFGLCIKNDNEYKYHENKPNTNSHSLSLRIARTIVNIAVENRLNISIVDPCCGVGTVVIEAASMGLDIKGYEINRKVAALAEENLAFFGVNNVIKCNDMHKIKDHYDVSIVDIPYGLFTSVSLNDQIEIIRTARRISDKAVIITFENMEQIITDSGFSITDQCYAAKGRFTRYINVCN